MKTWDMLKELNENPEKRFNGLAMFNDNYVYTKLKFKTRVEDGEIITNIDYFGVDNNYIETREIRGVFTDRLDMLDRVVWEEVKEPVDFMIALKARHRGKTIYCMHEGFKYIYESYPNEAYKVLKDDEESAICTEEILEGEWYIEEE